MDSLAAVSGADPLAKIQHLKPSAAGAAADPLAAVEGVEQKLKVPSPPADPLLKEEQRSGRRARGGNGSAHMFRCMLKKINKYKNAYI